VTSIVQSDEPFDFRNERWREVGDSHCHSRGILPPRQRPSVTRWNCVSGGQRYGL